jgi:prevent-host-death family protein
MATVYSLYDAKAKLSEIIRRVREGDTIAISYRGKPVAEIRPIAERAQTTDERFAELEARGIIVGSGKPRGKLRPIARRPGALKRFLAERD